MLKALPKILLMLRFAHVLWCDATPKTKFLFYCCQKSLNCGLWYFRKRLNFSGNVVENVKDVNNVQKTSVVMCFH